MDKKILIAEDDPDILFILDVMLKDAGYQVEPLKEGISIVDRKKDWPDLFIIDKDMPVIDGLAICKYLKLKKDTRDIPVIMISAHHALKQKAREAGVDDFIEKPFGLKSFLKAIEKHIHGSPQSGHA
jgi:DNA-binding response OmpR family regulator